ncbi:helix-turn-helix domain-containing protein [Neobacillus muris]|uniref:helix-turn-helix domain-containing protein n=1 Tax=Neobacillus muris TaxID=2941334 RepID=UPI00203D43AC|nr:helix-turn-helix transcriptional regulator [Neobacillus muris]
MCDGNREEMIKRAIEDIGGLIRDFRTSHFLTYGDMASLCGGSASYLFRIEHGKRNPDFDFRIKLLMAMDWSTEDIYLFLDEVISRGKTNKRE